MRDQKRKQVAADTTATADTISFDDAVREGKAIVAKIEDAKRALEDAERGQLRLGELAAKVETKYKDRTLAKFAKAIGIAPCTLARYRDVFRAYEAYEDICAPGRGSIPPYAVLRELATHPDREQIIRKHPDLTKREAQERMHKLRGAAKKKQEQEQEDECLRDNRRWFKNLVAVANDASRVAGIVDLDQCTPEQLDKLLQAVDYSLLMYVRGGGRMLANLADRLEALLEERERSKAVEASAPIKRTHPEATAHAAA